MEVKDPDTNERRQLKMFGREPIILTDDKVFNLFKSLDPDSDEVLEKDNRNFRILTLLLVLSMIINTVQNACVAYMKLHHYKEAKKCARYVRELIIEYPKSYLYEG